MVPLKRSPRGKMSLLFFLLFCTIFWDNLAGVDACHSSIRRAEEQESSIHNHSSEASATTGAVKIEFPAKTEHKNACLGGWVLITASATLVRILQRHRIDLKAFHRRLQLQDITVAITCCALAKSITLSFQTRRYDPKREIGQMQRCPEPLP